MSYFTHTQKTTTKNYEGDQRAEHDRCFVPLLNVLVLPGVKTCRLLVGHVVRNGPCQLHWALFGPAAGVTVVSHLSHCFEFLSTLLF